MKITYEIKQVKPWQNGWTFALNMHWTNVQCKMSSRFATLSNLVQSCSVMLRVVQSILKAVKNVQWTRLNFFCLKKMFSRFATPLNIVQFAQAHCKFKKGEFRDYREEMESSASISFMKSREKYLGSNEDSSDEINCSSEEPKAIAENKNTIMLMDLAAGRIDLHLFS